MCLIRMIASDRTGPCGLSWGLMDPLTQCLLGAAAGVAAGTRSLGRGAVAVGLLGGGLADVDVFLSPGADVLRHMVEHRGFTHALSFIPAGGVAAALPFMLMPSMRRRWRAVLATATAAYATHAVLDACTAYGTLLLWPFSDRRIAWDFISIIDPIFTLTLLVGVIWSAWHVRTRGAWAALIVCGLYMGLGAAQHNRALDAQRALAAERGHEIDRGRAHATLGNLIVWRSVYQAEGRLHTDGIRLPLFGAAQVRDGTSVQAMTEQELAVLSNSSTEAAHRLSRFRWFADGYVAALGEGFLGDIRYSARPESTDPLWGVNVARPSPEGHGSEVRWQSNMTERRAALKRIWSDIVRGEGYRALP